MKTALIITAGGSSRRYGKNKLIEKVLGKEVILHTLEAFSGFEFSQIVITSSEELKKYLEPVLPMSVKLVLGGKTRQESVFNGLKALAPCDFVAIHDGARPLADKETIKNCLEKAYETKAAIVAVRAVDTIKIADENGLIIETPDRKRLWSVQTPQVFEYKLILDAHKKLEGGDFSDDAGLLEFLGEKVYVSEGKYTNIKITTPSDIKLMNEFLI